MQNFHDILNGTVIQINKLLRCDRFKILKVSPFIYVKVFFSLAASIYITLSINKPFHMTVKYNVRDKIYCVNLRKSRIFRKEQSK